VKAGTPAGVSAKDYMEKGVLVPDEVLIAMFREKLTSPDCAKGFILDGFPRNLSQAKQLDTLLTAIDAKLDVVINLLIDDKLLTERITGRRVCSNKTCNAVFHVKFSPPKKDSKCDVCGSDLMQRSDDREELVKARLNTYTEQTEPLIEFYENKNILKTVNGEGYQNAMCWNILKALKVGV